MAAAQRMPQKGLHDEREKVGRRDSIPGLWLLLPGDNQALIDGKPVPLMGPGQKARIPASWLKNMHRG